MRKPFTALMLCVAIAAAPLALAQTKLDDVTDLQALRQAVKNDKRAYVESTLKLTDAEGKRFWPIYNAYQREVDLNNRRRNVALQELMFRDSAMSNLAAKHYVAELLAVDEAEIKARRTMRNRVMRALPAVKAARYMQLEEKIRAVQDYDEASVVPLAR
jgi:Spy/CpxP family protein refolding chaperone